MWIGEEDAKIDQLVEEIKRRQEGSPPASP